MLRFEFITDRLEAYKDAQGKMHIRGIASDDLEDLQRDRISLSALKKMVKQCKKGLPLLPEHRASFEIGMSTDAELRKNQQTNATEMVVDYILYDDYPQARTLFKEALAQECWRQLSIGGKLNENSTKPAYLEETADGRVVRVLNDLILDHIAVTRANMAANPRTGFLDAMFKSLDESGFSIDEFQGVLEKGEKYVAISLDEIEDKDAEQKSDESPGRKNVANNLLTSSNGALNIPSEDNSSDASEQRTSSKESQMGDEVLKATVIYKAWPLAAESAWDWNASRDGSTLLGADLDNWDRYKSAHTYYDSSLGATPTVKSGYSLPHHKLTDGGMKTYMSGVQRAVAALNGARGGFRRDTSPEGRISLYTHLRKHYEQAGRTAPPLKKEWLTKVRGESIPTKWGVAVEKDYEDFVSSLQSVGEAIPEWLTLKWWTQWDESITGLRVPPAEEKGVWAIPVEKSEEAEGPETRRAGTMQTPEERAEADRIAAEKTAQEKADAEKKVAEDKASADEKAKTDATAKAKEEQELAELEKVAEEAAKARKEDAKKEDASETSKEQSDGETKEVAGDVTAEDTAEKEKKSEEEKSAEEVSAEEAVEKATDKKEEKSEENADNSRLDALEQSLAQLASSVKIVAEAVKEIASSKEEKKTEDTTEVKAEDKVEEKKAGEEKSATEQSEEKKDDASESTDAEQAGNIFSSFKAVVANLHLSEKDALEQLMSHYGVMPVTADDLAKSVASLIEKSSTAVETTLAGKIDTVVKNLGDLTQRLETVEKVNGASQSIKGQETDHPVSGRGGVFSGVFSSATSQLGSRR